MVQKRVYDDPNVPQIPVIALGRQLLGKTTRFPPVDAWTSSIMSNRADAATSEVISFSYHITVVVCTTPAHKPKQTILSGRITQQHYSSLLCRDLDWTPRVSHGRYDNSVPERTGGKEDRDHGMSSLDRMGSTSAKHKGFLEMRGNGVMDGRTSVDGWIMA